LFRAWHEAEDYDAVVRIPDFRHFVDSIDLMDLIGEKRFRCYGDIRPVQYEDVPIDVVKVDCTSYAFMKDCSKFSWQCEIRASWPRIVREDAQPYILGIDNLVELFDVVDIPRSWLKRN